MRSVSVYRCGRASRAAAGAQPGIRPSSSSMLPDLVQGRARRRQDQLGRLQRLVGQGLAEASHRAPAARRASAGSPPRRRPPSRRAVRRPACSARRSGSSPSSTWPSPMIRTIMTGPVLLLVELPVLGLRAAGRLRGGRRPRWPAAARTDRPPARPSSAGAPARRPSRRRAGPARPGCRPWPRPLRSSSAPEASSSSIAPARACSCAVLSSARWMAMPTSPISSEMPEKASPIRVCAWAAV